MCLGVNLNILLLSYNRLENTAHQPKEKLTILTQSLLQYVSVNYMKIIKLFEIIVYYYQGRNIPNSNNKILLAESGLVEQSQTWDFRDGCL